MNANRPSLNETVDAFLEIHICGETERINLRGNSHFLGIKLFQRDIIGEHGPRLLLQREKQSESRFGCRSIPATVHVIFGALAGLLMVTGKENHSLCLLLPHRVLLLQYLYMTRLVHIIGMQPQDGLSFQVNLHADVDVRRWRQAHSSSEIRRNRVTHGGHSYTSRFRTIVWSRGHYHHNELQSRTPCG